MAGNLRVTECRRCGPSEHDNIFHSAREMKLQASLLIALGILIGGCERQRPASQPAMPASATSQPAQATVPTAPPPGAQHTEPQLPALYAGVLPCADCEGIRHELDLRPTNVFFLRMTYLGKPPPNTFDDIGQWSIHDDQVLTLRGGRDAPMAWSIEDVGTLRKLDVHGNPIDLSANLDITRQPSYASLEPQLQMRGMYQYMADAALFEECLTGLKMPVATEGESAAVERAYGKTGHEPGQPVLVSVEGRIGRRPAMEGDQLVDTLIVDKLGQFWPNEHCGARGVTHELESTRWVLVRLGDEVVTVTDQQREPFIVLESTEHRISGHGGCNRIVGGYQLDGEKITFTQLAMTRMACPDMKYEDAFGKALNAATNWKISGAYLELFGVNGMVIARFEERNL